MKKWLLPALYATAGVLMLGHLLDPSKADEFQMGEYRTLSRIEAERGGVDDNLYLIGLGLVSALIWTAADSKEPLICMKEIPLPLSGAQWRTILDAVDRTVRPSDDSRVSQAMFYGFWELFKCQQG